PATRWRKRQWELRCSAPRRTTPSPRRCPQIPKPSRRHSRSATPASPALSAHTETFANQIRQSLAGDGAHARAHFLYDSQTDGQRNQEPEQLVTVIRADRRESGDAARIVSGVSGY